MHAIGQTEIGPQRLFSRARQPGSGKNRFRNWDAAARLAEERFVSIAQACLGF
jgi:hypothetical protein